MTTWYDFQGRCWTLDDNGYPLNRLPEQDQPYTQVDEDGFPLTDYPPGYEPGLPWEVA